jgi:hypothetical protein
MPLGSYFSALRAADGVPAFRFIQQCYVKCHANITSVGKWRNLQSVCPSHETHFS